jgi:hypothetical protein
MPLPHFTQLLVTGSPGGPGSEPREPIYSNLFEINFILPTILVAQGRDPILMLQQATSIDINITPEIEYKTQRFKFSTREFATMPDKTSGDFKIKFQINQNKVGEMEEYNTLRAWYNLIHNNQNGALFYKADYIGTVIVNHHDRKGLILQRVSYQNSMLKGLTGFDLNWDGAELITIEANFIYDYPVYEVIDGKSVIPGTYVPGY